MTKQYLIADKKFATQKDLRTYISKLLLKYKHGTAVDNDDFLFLLDLLEHHPEAEKKKGCGIKSISAGRNKHGTPSFYLHRNDGSTDDFSTVKCVNNYSL